MLPVIAACILSGGKCVIEEVPMLEDVFVISDILRSIFAEINIDRNTNRIMIDTSNIRDCSPCSELVKNEGFILNNGTYDI